MSLQLVLSQSVALVMVFAVLNFQCVSSDPFATCTASERKCDSSCRYIGFCVPTGSTLKWKQTHDCGEEFCDSQNLVCTPDASKCPKVSSDIDCLVAGDYPDPTDCSVWYKCDPTVGAILQSCPENKNYNPCTKKCDLDATRSACHRTSCKKDHQIVPVLSNKKLFYYCLSTNPADPKNTNYHYVMDQCKDGGFDAHEKMCIPGTNTGCNSGETGTTESTETPTTPTTTPATVQCTSSGNLVPDPNNCHAYYYCNINLSPISLTCSDGYHFVVGQNGCVVGSC